MAVFTKKTSRKNLLSEKEVVMENEALQKKIALVEERLAFLEKENKRLGRAEDIHEIQNVMSLHEYYHSSFKHKEELDAIWAQKAPDVAFEEALFEARFVGLEAINRYYVDFMRNFLFKSAGTMIREWYPQLKDEPEEELPFGLAYMHTLTTPVIEVAEDRETAKGVWVSPGFITMPGIKGLQAFWHWDRYGVDFIKEDGKWKIWHFFVGREFTTPYEKSFVDTGLDNEETYELALQLFKEWPGLSGMKSKPLNAFDSYSPFKVNKLKPRLPEPYRTFSETFSY
nr:nuclear transport factor 2 family protein [Candidatus Freyarchaeota archaeon]